ncbi:MAG TPA: 50S ribosomal protein L29 [Polyangium sp.]|jgi:large subunit ribosomal protein L29|nr:50S ribosomal protein L29 [Polyangium sp.]
MKSKDLRERTTEHLQELEKTLARDVFDAKFKNFTNRLNDTSSVRKARRDLARVKTILTQRADAEIAAAVAAELQKEG